MYDASNLLFGDHFYDKSDGVKWVDVNLPEKRKRRVKSHSRLNANRENDPESTDIFEDNLVEDIYPRRRLPLRFHQRVHILWQRQKRSTYLHFP